MSAITNFLMGEGNDNQGRNLNTVLGFDDSKWDECHDFIQWLFPLPVESKFAEFSPVLTHLDVETCNEQVMIQVGMLFAVKRFMQFLGFETAVKRHKEDRIRFNRSNKFDQQAKYWLKARDHNHLRISRMLQSLVLFEQENVALEIFKALSLVKCDFPDCITDETMVYWRNALTGYSY